MANEIIPANSAVVFPVTLLIDGAIWNLTGATVSLRLRRGDTVSAPGALTEHPATITAAAKGEAECELSPADMALARDGREWADERASRWERQWRVLQAGDDVKSLWIPFTVQA